MSETRQVTNTYEAPRVVGIESVEAQLYRCKGAGSGYDGGSTGGSGGSGGGGGYGGGFGS